MAQNEELIDKIVKDTIHSLKNENQEQKILDSIQQAADNFAKVYEKGTDVQQVFNQAHLFVDAVYTKLYNRVLKYVYIFEDSQGILYSIELTPKEILNQTYLYKEPEFYAKEKGAKKYQKFYQKKVSEKDFKENSLGEDHVARIRTVYKHAENRLKRSTAKRAKKLMFKSERTDDTWYVTSGINFGNLKEAYFDALMREHNSEMDYLCKIQNMGEELYGSHEEIRIFYDEYISKLDNANWVFTGDVNTEEKENNNITYVSYLVKSKGFSIAGLETIYDAAQKMKKLTSDDLDKGINNYLKTIMGNSKAEIYNTVKKYLVKNEKTAKSLETIKSSKLKKYAEKK